MQRSTATDFIRGQFEQEPMIASSYSQPSVAHAHTCLERTIGQGRRRGQHAASRSSPARSGLRVLRAASGRGVTTCETFAAESLGRPVIRAVSSTLPGASAHRRLLVSGTQTTVATRLRFRASPWITTTGRRNPGPEPVGAGNSAQHTSPWEITIRHDRARVAPAAARKESSLSPTSSHTRFIVSVISSCAWRATYSSSAAAYTSLRDRCSRRASCSARSKMSSGIDTAVFIPLV